MLVRVYIYIYRKVGSMHVHDLSMYAGIYMHIMS